MALVPDVVLPNTWQEAMRGRNELFGSWFEGRQSIMAEKQEQEAAGYIVCTVEKQ